MRWCSSCGPGSFLGLALRMDSPLVSVMMLSDGRVRHGAMDCQVHFAWQRVRSSGVGVKHSVNIISTAMHECFVSLDNNTNEVGLGGRRRR